MGRQRSRSRGLSESERVPAKPVEKKAAMSKLIEEEQSMTGSVRTVSFNVVGVAIGLFAEGLD